MCHGALYRSAFPVRVGRGRKAVEPPQGALPLDRYEGEAAAQRVSGLQRPEYDEEDGYVLSSVEALTMPKPSGARVSLLATRRIIFASS